LPYQEAGLEKYYEQSRIFIKTTGKHYTIANFAKGGVVKVFDLESNKLVFNDCGIIGKMEKRKGEKSENENGERKRDKGERRREKGKIVTSQWVDPDYQVTYHGSSIEVTGFLNHVPSNKLFTPLKNIVFRTTLMALGWYPPFAHFLKGQIRKALILGQRKAPVKFTRKLEIKDENISLQDKIELTGNEYFSSLSIGDEFFVRYVPQSRYFQAQELKIKGYELSQYELKQLREDKTFRNQISIS